jgi:hypothetical protein
METSATLQCDVQLLMTSWNFKIDARTVIHCVPSTLSPNNCLKILYAVSNEKWMICYWLIWTDAVQMIVDYFNVLYWNMSAGKKCNHKNSDLVKNLQSRVLNRTRPEGKPGTL